MYRSEKDEYKNMRRDGRALAYKHATKHIKKRINEKGKEIVENSFDSPIDRMSIDAESNCFRTIKGHKENFSSYLKVPLINSAKNELRRISKTILNNIIRKLFEATKINH